MVLALALLANCSGASSDTESALAPAEHTVQKELNSPTVTPLHSERGGIGLQFQASNNPARTALLPLDLRRSLVVTEQAIVSTFTLKEVLDQLVAQGNVPGLTSLQLFRQLWDT
ncbi:hypothetical protein, partial [Corallococcus llansteffanensis]|uniref:hypothetical protein n=1 Tax=Corallococcus llansteffanensis TaxID=2316731 RepID=UPI00244716FC